MPATRRPAVLHAVALSLLAMAVAACGRGPGAGPDTDGTTDNVNTCTTQVVLPQRPAALEQATSVDAVDWTIKPKIENGVLVATGTLDPGVEIFDPLTPDGDQRDSPAFSVYRDYDGTMESFVELVPDFLDDSKCWESTATFTTVEIGTPEGAGDRGFTIEASSPLFRDVAGSGLELRVWGTDANGNDALLSKVSIATE